MQSSGLPMRYSGPAHDDITENETPPGESESELGMKLKRWRSTRRRRSTLRTTLLKYTIQTKSPTRPRDVGSQRVLLLHGPAYKIMSSLASQADAYLFLFTDILVVTRQSQQSVFSTSLRHTPPAIVSPPLPDVESIPSDMHFKVQVVIPLDKDVINLTLMRTGASYRQGETEEQQDARLGRQERVLRKGSDMFSHNPNDAIIYLIKRRIVQPAAEKVAAFLHRCILLDRRQLANFIGFGLVGKHLSGSVSKEELHEERQYHRSIWKAFLERCQLQGLPLVESLRVVLHHLNLPMDAAVTNTMLELFTLHWFEKNRHYHSAITGAQRNQHPSTSGSGTGMFKKLAQRKDKKLDTQNNAMEVLNSLIANEPIWVPDGVDVALKLVFWMVTIGRSQKAQRDDPASSEREFRDFVSHFRVSMLGDQPQANRKENVLRKRDQPRVTTFMEVPMDELTAVWESIRRFGLNEILYSHHIAPEFDVSWVRDKRNMYGVGLSEKEIQSEIEEVYSDAGHRDGLLVNPSSDRIPAKINVSLPCYLRVTIKLPRSDPHFFIGIRACSASTSSFHSSLLSPTHGIQTTTNKASHRATVYGNAIYGDGSQIGLVDSPGTGGPEQPIVDILPSPVLQFQRGPVTSFILVPRTPGHVTLQFINYGERARCYSPIPARTILVEGGFMHHTLQMSWAKSKASSSDIKAAHTKQPTALSMHRSPAGYPVEYSPPTSKRQSFTDIMSTHDQEKFSITKARYMFGFDSDTSKSIWALALQEALGTQANVSDEAGTRAPMYETNPSLSPSHNIVWSTTVHTDHITRILQAANSNSKDPSSPEAPRARSQLPKSADGNNQLHSVLSGSQLVNTVLQIE